ncbi:MAG: metal-dependent hydrolase [Chloroflexi bacterium HGW-Chloroflexi-4]|jgi:L-ascorbate metabolism protein UlaG (beta-lactamase superfamily)|nr:MAG: metal-dependent hydrolase [Chloroflexi bacterium HGW-Chloroflexi-4]
MTSEVIWYGHATIGIITAGYFILVDPFFTGNPLTNVNPDELSPDFILVTHGHGDHLGDTEAIAKRTSAMVISNGEIVQWLSKKSIKTHAQQVMGGFQHPFGYLKLTLALHGSVLPDGAFGGNPVGLLLTTQDKKKIYLAGDTGLFGDMKLIGEEGIDLAMLPIGGNYTMDPDDALRAVKLIAPKLVVPIHYDTFDVIKQDPNLWADRIKAETKTEVRVMKPGDSITL